MRMGSGWRPVLSASRSTARIGAVKPRPAGRCASPDGPGLDRLRAPRPGTAMTDHHPPTKPAGPPPTDRQQRYLRQLALQRGVSFVPPKTRAEASRAIDALKRRRPEPLADRRREIRAVQDDMARNRGDAAQVREGIETTGYGSSATWTADRS